MNREQYLQMRQTGQLSINLIYQFYTKFNTRKEYEYTIEQFAQLFNSWIGFFGFNTTKIFEHFDKEFSINQVQNKEGQIIKYY